MSIRNALHELLSLANLQENAGEEVAYLGEDRFFPTPYLVGTAGAAVLGAVGKAASQLWMLKTNRKQAGRANAWHASCELQATLQGRAGVAARGLLLSIAK